MDSQLDHDKRYIYRWFVDFVAYKIRLYTESTILQWLAEISNAEDEYIGDTSP